MRYLSLDGLCNLCTSDFSQEAVRKHQEVVINALKVNKTLSAHEWVGGLLIDVPYSGKWENFASVLIIMMIWQFWRELNGKFDFY